MDQFTKKLSPQEHSRRLNEIKSYYLVETVKLSIVTGPLYCLSNNLQFLSSELVKRNQITSTSKSFFQFLNKGLPTLSIVRPFKHSFYRNYLDILTNFYKQGLNSFYKGNLTRLSYFTTTNALKSQLDFYTKALKFPNFIKDIVVFSIVDIVCNPLLYLESKISTSNAKKLYNGRSWLTLLTNDNPFRGSTLNVPRNILFVAGLNTSMISESIPREVSIAIGHILAYPILTVHRNVMLQSYVDPTAPRPAAGPYSHFTRIYNTNGVVGFYRGFISFSVATALWHAVVPKQAKLRYMRNLLEDDDVEKLRIKDYEAILEEHKE